ncbi:RAMP superfamily CRISPR-associated protein [uncultured Thalassospira sp.]|uniref:RAMP superfamily CRISPR-associated protein n=1 Tax=uncultured Thalassospira sp. TaxID=404382 RepID=UPI0030D8AC52|tara:strand:- start:6220 stop:7581 length:1362 start_codon:yes stop_codon:yes gene_type:complete
MLSHYRFTLELELLSDLHLGTGETVKLSELRKSNHGASDDADPEVSVTAKDGSGMPYLTATAIKAAARRLVLGAGQEDLCDKLFGKINSTPTYRKGAVEVSTNEGRMGRLSFGYGRMVHARSELPPLPLYDAKTRCWISTRTRIDGATGTVKRHHLFNREYVVAQTRFEVDCIFTGTAKEVADDLGILLGLIKKAGYLAIGQGSRFGSGRIKLGNTCIKGMMTTFDPVTFSIKNQDMSVAPIESDDVVSAPQKTWHLALRATAPFLIADPYGRGGEDDEKGANNVIHALRTPQGGPALPPSSLFGVLRARAVWLASLENPDHRDDPDLKPSAWSSGADLSVTERLFGVSGWRGTLELDAIVDTADNGYVKKFSGIAIDRFSGGVIDGALFSVEAFCHAAFRVGLKLCARGSGTQEEEAFVSRLVKAVIRDGLEIGHGTNSGFGWFNVVEGEKK